MIKYSSIWISTQLLATAIYANACIKSWVKVNVVFLSIIMMLQWTGTLLIVLIVKVLTDWDRCGASARSVVSCTLWLDRVFLSSYQSRWSAHEAVLLSHGFFAFFLIRPFLLPLHLIHSIFVIMSCGMTSDCDMLSTYTFCANVSVYYHCWLE